MYPGDCIPASRIPAMIYPVNDLTWQLAMAYPGDLEIVCFVLVDNVELSI